MWCETSRLAFFGLIIMIRSGYAVKPDGGEQKLEDSESSGVDEDDHQFSEEAARAMQWMTPWPARTYVRQVFSLPAHVCS